ncbi:MAG: ABC transporter permease [Desulfobacterales bacterium]|nr:ABC transporter permease [Desulfobacterales bacterium]
MDESLNQTAAVMKQRITRIEASKGLARLDLRELWDYKDLLWFHTLKEVKGKYRQMALGPLWIILQPIINMIIFTLIFGEIAKLPSEGIPYPIFTYVALLPWALFQNSCEFSSHSLVAQMHIIAKVYFPRMIIPIASTLSWLVDFVLSFGVLLIMMFFFGFIPGWRIIFIPLYLIMAVAFALAIGFCTASLAVQFRDIKFVVDHGLRVFMYLTPVAYSGTLVPEQWQWLYQLNPMYWVVEGFRWSLLGTSAGPDWYMVFPLGLTAFLLIVGAYMFRRTERTVVDLL